MACGGVVFLCTLESFLGLIYAGMAAAILFGKVSRIQSHAHLTFSNGVCLQYAEVDFDFCDEESSDSDCDTNHHIDRIQEDDTLEDPAETTVSKSVDRRRSSIVRTPGKMKLVKGRNVSSCTLPGIFAR